MQQGQYNHYDETILTKQRITRAWLSIIIW